MTELDIKRKLFATYQEYLSNHYPSDPNIYVIRAHPETVQDLKAKSLEYQADFSSYSWDGGTIAEPRFLGFRYHPDLRLPVGDIIFGPETVDIKWSK